MKPLLIGLSVIILYITFTPYQQDNNEYMRQLENLKYVADECAASSSLYLDESISDSNIVFNRTEGKKAIEKILQDSLKLDNGLNPLDGSYWQEKIKYDVYYIDDGNTTFPYMFIDKRTGYKKLISEPTVIITIDGGKPRFRLSFLQAKNGVRSSGYEYVAR